MSVSGASHVMQPYLSGDQLVNGHSAEASVHIRTPVTVRVLQEVCGNASPGVHRSEGKTKGLRLQDRVLMNGDDRSGERNRSEERD